MESQRDFLESLSSNEKRRNVDRSKDKSPPIANSYALGYTYYDVLDADQDGRLGIKQRNIGGEALSTC